MIFELEGGKSILGYGLADGVMILLRSESAGRLVKIVVEEGDWMFGCKGVGGFQSHSTGIILPAQRRQNGVYRAELLRPFLYLSHTSAA